jgi:hypothetical protein
MRKLITGDSTQLQQSGRSGDWLDLEQLAQVEITSEDPEHPIESALLQNNDSGWRADEPGKQTIRLVFDNPQKIRHIQLLFEEPKHERTQEFVLRWSPDARDSDHEIVRQQCNFSPASNTRELEDYTVNLDDVLILEINITPDISGGNARASLARLRLA